MNLTSAELEVYLYNGYFTSLEEHVETCRQFEIPLPALYPDNAIGYVLVGSEQGTTLEPAYLVEPPTLPIQRILGVYEILRTHQAHVIEGTLVDVQTANAIRVVYQNLTLAHQRNFTARPIQVMGAIAWKLVH